MPRMPFQYKVHHSASHTHSSARMLSSGDCNQNNEIKSQDRSLSLSHFLTHTSSLSLSQSDLSTFLCVLFNPRAAQNVRKVFSQICVMRVDRIENERLLVSISRACFILQPFSLPTSGITSTSSSRTMEKSLYFSLPRVIKFIFGL